MASSINLKWSGLGLSLSLGIFCCQCKTRQSSNLSGSNTVTVYSGFEGIERVEVVLKSRSSGQKHNKLLRTNCSGSFLTDSIFLTAAHCASSSKDFEFISATVSGHKPVNILIHPKYKALDQKISTLKPDAQKDLEDWSHIWIRRHDLAILVFDQPIAQGLVYLSQGEINYHDQFFIVGFGITSNFREKDANGKMVKDSFNKWREKRCGFTKLRSQSHFKSLIFAQGDSRERSQLPGLDSSSASGDSGGPLLSASGHIIGVVQAGGAKKKRDFAVYTSILERSNRDFVLSALGSHKQDSNIRNISLEQNNALRCLEHIESPYQSVLIEALGFTLSPVAGGDIDKQRKEQGIESDSDVDSAGPHYSGMGLTIDAIYSSSVIPRNELQKTTGILIGVDGIAFEYPNQLRDYVNEKLGEDPQHKFKFSFLR